MKNVLTKLTSRSLIHFMVAIQALTILMMTIFFLGNRYSADWQNYSFDRNSNKIYLSNLSESKQDKIKKYILDNAVSDHIFLIKSQTTLSNDGSASEKIIGFYGDPNKKDLSMSYLGTKVIDQKSIRKLLNSNNPNATLGIEQGSINSVGSIPSFNNADKIVVKKLESLIDKSDGVQGAYQIVGSHKQRKKFITGLVKASGKTYDELLAEKFGSFEYDSLYFTVAAVVLALTSFLIFVSLSSLIVKSIDKLGKTMLLGWSKLDFFKALLIPFFNVSILMIPLLALIGFWISGWPSFSIPLISYLFLAGVCNTLLLFIISLFASLTIFIIKPLDAIHERIPKKFLYFLSGTFYLIFSVLLVYGGWSFDGPLNELSYNARLSLHWQSVSKMQVLNDVSVGQDSQSFTGQSNQLDQSFYDWYKSIANKKGVYLINSDYYSKKIINENNANFPKTQISNQPFWKMTFSPNYLSKIGIKVTKEQLSLAKKGYRLYLLPDTLSKNDLKQKEHWIKANDTSGIQSDDVKTIFNQKKQFLFVLYHPGKKIFTWSTQESSKRTSTTTTPIIYVTTPENMSYVQAGSLRAAGLEGYIKFENQATMKKFTSNKLFNKFNLSDNQPKFLSVKNYVDGLEKDIWKTIRWFGTASVFLMIVLILNLLSLATIFRISNEERISIKKFLGYSYFQLYCWPIAFISIIFVCQLIASVLIRSKLAIAEVILLFLIQMLIFWKYMSKNEFKQILELFKGE
ncbi:hypothetical protein FCS83_05955 [Oenococcus sp. UCMA 17063]|nr:hypothetical protein [Oenococcus sp. UCMA 17063]